MSWAHGVTESTDMKNDTKKLKKAHRKMTAILKERGVQIGAIHSFRSFVRNMAALTDAETSAEFEAFSIRNAARRLLGAS